LAVSAVSAVFSNPSRENFPGCIYNLDSLYGHDWKQPQKPQQPQRPLIHKAFFAGPVFLDGSAPRSAGARLHRTGRDGANRPGQPFGQGAHYRE